jgi:hypothetical protein
MKAFSTSKGVGMIEDSCNPAIICHIMIKKIRDIIEI